MSRFKNDKKCRKNSTPSVASPYACFLTFRTAHTRVLVLFNQNDQKVTTTQWSLEPLVISRPNFAIFRLSKNPSGKISPFFRPFLTKTPKNSRDSGKKTYFGVKAQNRPRRSGAQTAKIRRQTAFFPICQFWKKSKNTSPHVRSTSQIWNEACRWCRVLLSIFRLFSFFTKVSGVKP